MDVVPPKAIYGMDWWDWCIFGVTIGCYYECRGYTVCNTHVHLTCYRYVRVFANAPASGGQITFYNYAHKDASSLHLKEQGKFIDQ